MYYVKAELIKRGKEVEVKQIDKQQAFSLFYGYILTEMGTTMTTTA